MKTPQTYRVERIPASKNEFYRWFIYTDLNGHWQARFRYRSLARRVCKLLNASRKGSPS